MQTRVTLHDFLDAGPRLLFGPRVRNRCHFIVKSRIALLRLPRRWSTVAKKHFNFLDGLSAGFGVREPELNSAAETECAEDDEEAPADVEEGRGNEKADCKIEDPVAVTG